MLLKLLLKLARLFLHRLIQWSTWLTHLFQVRLFLLGVLLNRLFHEITLGLHILNVLSHVVGGRAKHVLVLVIFNGWLD